MAFYGDEDNVKQATGDGLKKYDREWKPGRNPSYPGIYECQTCGYEDVINRECTSLPPCSNCDSEHMKWKLVVRPADK
jgi:hypothetical protein